MTKYYPCCIHCPGFDHGDAMWHTVPCRHKECGQLEDEAEAE